MNYELLPPKPLKGEQGSEFNYFTEAKSPLGDLGG